MTKIEDQPQTANYVELDWYDESEIVKVHPRDRQRFEVQKDRAIEVLRASKESEAAQKQFDLLISTLAAWANHWKQKIAQAILTLQDGTLALVVVQQSEKYDEEFQDAILELDFDIANNADFDLVKLKTLLLPNVSGDALASFLDDHLLLLIYRDGERERPHQVS